MTKTTDSTGEAAIVPPLGSSVVVDAPPNGRPGGQTPMPRLGVWSWGFVGFVAAAVIVFLALGAVSEIVLPMTFAAVLGSSSSRWSVSSSGTGSSPAWPLASSSSVCSC